MWVIRLNIQGSTTYCMCVTILLFLPPGPTGFLNETVRYLDTMSQQITDTLISLTASTFPCSSKYFSKSEPQKLKIHKTVRKICIVLCGNNFFFFFFFFYKFQCSCALAQEKKQHSSWHFAHQSFPKLHVCVEGETVE